MYINYFLTNICSFRIIILRIIVDWGNVVHDPYHMDVCMCAYTVAYEIEFYHNARQSHIYLMGNFVEMPIIQKNVDLLEHFPSIFFFFINYSLLPFALIKLHRVSARQTIVVEYSITITGNGIAQNGKKESNDCIIHVQLEFDWADTWVSFDMNLSFSFGFSSYVYCGHWLSGWFCDARIHT